MEQRLLSNFKAGTMDEHTDIDILLWEYIDGTGSVAERDRIATLIATDTEWKAKYEELLALADGLKAMDMEEPTVRFTKNVMDLIGEVNTVPSVRSYVNPMVIKAIAAFFALSLIVTTVFAFMSAGNTAIEVIPKMVTPKMPLHMPSLQHCLTDNTITMLLSINVVLGLLFLDTFLRQRLKHRRHI